MRSRVRIGGRESRTEAVILWVVFGVETGCALLEKSSCSSRGKVIGTTAVELRRCWRRHDWQIFGDCPDDR